MVSNIKLWIWLSWRYVVSKHTTNKINIIIWVTILGISVATAAMVVVLGAFSAIEDLNKSAAKQMVPHLRIAAKKGKWMPNPNQVIQLVKKTDGVLNMAPLINEKAYVSYNQKSDIVTALGVDNRYNVLYRLDTAMLVGQFFEPNTKGTLLSLGLAQKLSMGIQITDGIQLALPKAGQGQIGKPEDGFSTDFLEPQGIIRISNQDYMEVLMVPMGVMQRLLGVDSNQYYALDIMLASFSDMIAVQEKWQKALGGEYKVSNQNQLNAALYKLVNTEKLITYLIFVFVLIIGVFNLASTLITLIIEKRRYFFILHSMGLHRSSIRMVFLILGGYLTLISMGIGVCMGMVILFIQKQYGIVSIAISHNEQIAFPVNIDGESIMATSATVFFFGMLITALVVWMSKFTIEKVN